MVSLKKPKQKCHKTNKDCTIDETSHQIARLIGWMFTKCSCYNSTHRLLSHIRILHLAPEYIVSNLYKMPLLEDTQCRCLVEEATKYHLLPARKLDYSGPRMRYRADDDLEEVLLVGYILSWVKINDVLL